MTALYYRSVGMEECKIPAWAIDKMFPSPDRLVRLHPVRVAESCVRSCYCVLFADRRVDYPVSVLILGVGCSWKNFGLKGSVSRDEYFFLLKITGSQATSWMLQKACWRGLLEGFSQVVSVFIEASQTLSSTCIFSITRQQKKFKNHGRIYKKDCTDSIFNTFKKLFISRHSPFKSL